MINNSEIQEWLSSIASGKISVWDFKRWLEEASWNMHQSCSQDVIELVGILKLHFEDYYHGVLNESQLVEELLSVPVIEVLNFGYSDAQIDALPYHLAFTLGEQLQELAYA